MVFFILVTTLPNYELSLSLNVCDSMYPGMTEDNRNIVLVCVDFLISSITYWCSSIQTLRSNSPFTDKTA